MHLLFSKLSKLLLSSFIHLLQETLISFFAFESYKVSLASLTTHYFLLMSVVKLFKVYHYKYNLNNPTKPE